MIGSTLDKYEVLEKVGEGGMATVYRGRHSTLKRDVAIKVLHPHLSSSSRNRKRFAREARAIEHLRHPNILEIFDYSGLDAEECYIVTEFVQGETLSSLLWRRGRLPSEIAAIIGRDLALALASAHREGILHRDLKPDNVMLRADGTVKLMDFGIARFLDESQVTMTGALVGSPAFMSPEQAREGALDARSDLFSLGTALFYLVTGQLPFSGTNPSVTLKNVIEANRPNVAELTPAISPTLADVIERCMATNRDDRYPRAEDVVAGLEATLAESGIDASRQEWSLGAYLQEPEAWERRLEEHLRTHLLARGKELLDHGDHLAALRLLNRLLSMDADNPEVLALVQGLHGEAKPKRRVSWLLGASAVASVGVALIAVVGWTAAHPAPKPVDPGSHPPAPVVHPAPATSVEAAAQVPAPSPTAVAPAVATQVLVPTPPPRPPIHPLNPRPEPVPEPLPPPPVLPPGLETGTLLLTSRDALAADIWEGTDQLGRIGKELVLPVGTHDLVVKNSFVEPVKLRVTIAPGERTQQEVALQPVPKRFIFANWEDRCAVAVNGVDKGRISALPDAAIVVGRPDQPQEVEVTCGDDRPERFPYAQGIAADTRIVPR